MREVGEVVQAAFNGIFHRSYAMKARQEGSSPSPIWVETTMIP